MDSLYLVDGSNFLFRAYHAMPPMTTSAGVPTGAVRGFASMLLRLLGEYQPSHVAVIFDAGGRCKRTELLPSYKANRTETPPDLRPQFDLARRVVTAMGVRSLDAVDVEADDLIATYARQAQRQGLQVVVVSSDKDLMQLCSPGQISLLDTMKEEGRGKLYGIPEVIEKWGVGPEQLGDVLALMGDSSDNLPGVPGVGQKTAAQLIQTFGSITELLRRIDEITVRGKDKIQAALRANAEQLLLVRKLVALEETAPTPLPLLELSRQPVLKSDLVMLLRELEFSTLLKRLVAPGGMPGMPDLSDEAARVATVGAAAAPAGSAAVAVVPSAAAPVPVGAAASAEAAPGESTEAAAKKAAESAVTSAVLGELVGWLAATAAPVQVVLTEAQLAQAVTTLQQAGPSALLAVVPQWCEDAHKGHHARLSPVCGLALCGPGAGPVYIPFGHRYLGMPTQLPVETVLQALRPLLTDAKLRKSAFGAKEVQQGLAQLQVAVAGIVTDPSLCSYLLEPGESHSLDDLLARHLPTDYPALPSRESLCHSGKHHIGFDAVEVQRAGELAGAEARATLLLGELLHRKLDVAGRQLLADLELPLASVLAQIEQHGILLDLPVLKQLSAEAAARLATLEAEITAAAGVSINLNSPKQLAELLFEKLGLEPVKKTKGKGGQSVDAEVLEALAAENPIARQIHDHRSLTKLKGTYLDQFPLLASPTTGRLHTSYQQVVAATGRLSSTEPNLQNIPIRTEFGKQIRRAFIAPPGRVLISADYSQIELRVMAHLSSDPLLVHSFQSGEDVHERTAIEMFGPAQGRTSDKRRAAKMINYGIIYGLTDYGLATRLGIERRVAKQYIEDYFVRYRGVKDFMEQLVLRARRDGGARTLLGRFRPLPELTTKNFAARSYAERMAKNTPLQGTAADILKQAMINVQAALLQKEPSALMLLTVHDELVIEAPVERAEVVSELLRTTMEQAVTLRVPLKVDVGAAKNWGDC